MTEFEMSVGDATIVALTDMNCAYPTPAAGALAECAIRCMGTLPRDVF